MKKVFKSRAFLMIITAIVFTGIGAFAAAKIAASEIEYSTNVSVKDKIDDLYSKVKSDYTGETTYTPTTSTQTILTNNKILTSDITINPIPSSYKELTTATTVTSNNLLDGITAYDNNGNLITGSISTECISGSYVKPVNTYININLGFTPTRYSFYFSVSSGNKHYVSYNSMLSSSSYDFVLASNGEYSNSQLENKMPATDVYTISDGKIVDNTGASTGRYTESFTVYYMACK